MASALSMSDSLEPVVLESDGYDVRVTVMVLESNGYGVGE
jgi:hypothetical protein